MSTLSPHHKHFKFIVPFIEYIFPSIEKTHLKDFMKSCSEFKWERGYRSTGVKQDCVK